MKDQLKLGVLLSYLSTLISIISQLVYMPIMIKLLGKSEYGLYTLVSSVVSYLSLFSLGFTGAYVRFYSRLRNDRTQLASLNGLFILLFMFLSILAVVCGLTLCSFPKLVFGTKLTEFELEKAQMMMLILVLNIGFTLLSSVFSSIINAHEQFVFLRIVGIVSSIANPFICLPLLLMGYRSLMLVIVTTAITISSFVLNLWYCLSNLRIPISFRQIRWTLLKEISIFSLFLLINMIIDQINWNIDKLILGHTSGTDEIAVYGVASQFNTLFMMFSTTISSVFVPRVNRMVAEQRTDSYKVLSDLMAKIGRIQWMIMSFISIGFIVFGKYFIVNVFAGRGYEASYITTLLLVIPAVIPLIQNIGIEIQRAMNMHQFRSVVYLLISIVNVCISIPLAQKWGAVGAASGTAVSLIVGNGIIMNLFYHHVMHLDMNYFWKEILKTWKGLFIPVLFGIMIMKVIEFSSIGIYLLCIVIFSIVYCVSIYRFSCNDYERHLIRHLVKRND